MSSEHPHKVRLMYIGRGRAAKGSALLYRFVVVTGMSLHGRPPGEDTAIAFKRVTASTIGAVYELDASTPEADAVDAGSKSYVGRWADCDELTVLAAADRALRGAHASEQRERRDKRLDPFADSIAPLRQAYRRARGAQRAQLLACIVAEITR